MRITVPEVTLVPLRVTVYEEPEPVSEISDHPELVPDSDISESKSPETDSVKERLYVSDVDWLLGDETVAAKLETAGFNIVRTTTPCPVRAPRVCVTSVVTPAEANDDPPPPLLTRPPPPP